MRVISAAIASLLFWLTSASPPGGFEDIEFFWELNDTDGDLGVQLKLGAEEPYTELEIMDPAGNSLLFMEVMEVVSGSKLHEQGLSDLHFESGEPNFNTFTKEEILQRFPAGWYTFHGTSITGEDMEGRARLTHKIPAAVVITSPEEDDELDPDENLVIEWTHSSPGIQIESYEIIVTNDEDEQFESAQRLGPQARRAVVDSSFLEPDVEYEVEVLARETSGNQVITIVFFTTSE